MLRVKRSILLCYLKIGLFFVSVLMMPELVFATTLSDIEEWERQRAVKPLIKALGNENSNIRESAAEALGKIGDPKAVESLIKALRDEDSDVRESAAEALSQIGWEPRNDKERAYYLVAKQEWEKTVSLGSSAVEPLIKVLGDWYVRENAVEALVKIGKPAVEPLIKALEDRNWFVRASAAWALGKIGDPRAVKPLIKTLEDEDSDVQTRVTEALGKISDPRAVESLIKALEDEDSDVRASAAEALVKIGKPAVEPLIKVLGDEDPNIRESAVEALVKIGKLAVEPLIKVLGDEDSDVRESAAEALGKIGDPKAVESLIKALRDEDSDVRESAAEALGKIGDPKAVKPLIKALGDEDPNIRESAAEALGKIGDPKAAKPLIRALEDWDLDVRASAAGALNQIGWKPRNDKERGYYLVAEQGWKEGGLLDSSAVEPLVIVLKSGCPLLFPSVFSGLMRIHQPTLEEKITTALKIGFTIPQNMWITFFSFCLGLLFFYSLKDFFNEYLRIKVKLPGLPFLFLLSYNSAILTSTIFFILFSGGTFSNILFTLITLFLLYLVCPFLIGAILFLLFLPAYSGKWLRAKKEARLFICPVCFCCHFTLGTGLPFLVRWSSRIIAEEEPKIYENFQDYFICKKCEGRKKIENIKQVIGLIGGDVEDYKVDEDKLYVNLWFEKEEKARNADINVLEIRRSNKHISYDLAIRKVYIELYNDASRPPDYVKTIPVIIEDNQLKESLPTESMHILEYEFGGVKGVIKDA